MTSPNKKYGIIFISLGLLFNEWILCWLFSGDGVLSANNQVKILVFNIFFVSLGLFILMKRPLALIKCLRVCFYNLIILLIGVIIVELLLGNWITPNNLNKLYIVKDVKIQQNLNGLYESNDQIITEIRDKYGFRGKYNDVKEIDILTIGGSTCRQRYITEGKTWQDIIHKEFLKEGKDVFVVNAGISGQSTSGNIRNFDYWFPLIPLLKAKYVIVYVGNNDLFNTKNDELDDLTGANNKKRKNTFLIENIKTHSALYYLWKTLKGIYLANVIYPINTSPKKPFNEYTWTGKPLLKEHEKIMKTHLESYEKRLRVLCKKIIDFGSIPIFVSQTGRAFKKEKDTILGVNDIFHYPISKDGQNRLLDYNGVDYYYMLRLLNTKTNEFCKESGIMFIDLANNLHFNSENDFYDWVHNTPQGTKKIGHFIYSKIKHLF